MRFRADVEGLRGVAVALVILFHTGLERFAGGFVGVDVFFVISGFLISGQSIGQLDNTGRVRFPDFWARRFRRLMPLLAVTVTLTLVAGMFVYSPLFWHQLAKEGVWSSLYVSNVSFAADSAFYFQSATSPLLHTWSLSVEEQFYVVWPLTIGIVGFAAYRFRRSTDRWLIAVVAIGTTASFALGLLVTQRGSPWAFYSSPTRAWEFGAGALAFLITRRRAVLRPGHFCILGWCGFSAILIAGLLFGPFTPIPGTAAAIPAIGTAAILVAGLDGDRFSVNRLLSIRPLRSIGRVSYAWYLFHWPAIVLTAAYVQRASALHAALASAASLGLAYLATWAIERPLRASPRLRAPLQGLTAAALVIALLVSGALVMDRQANRALDDPYLTQLLAVREGRTETGSADCSDRPVHSGSIVSSVCVYGDPESSTMVMLVGDSHAAQWSPAFEHVATRLGLALVVRTRGGCPASDLAVARTGDDRTSSECLSFRAETMRLFEALRPDLVVAAAADYTTRTLSSPRGEFLDNEGALKAAGAAVVAFAESVVSHGARLAIIENNPSQEREPIECLARHRSPVHCSITTEAGTKQVTPLAEVTRDRLAHIELAGVLETLPLICDLERCLVERDDVVVYADHNHLARSFVLGHTNEVQKFVTSALDIGA